MAKIVIIGAGLGGLSAAFRLRQFCPEAELTVLESRPTAGGNIGTIVENGFRVETGPNGFLDNKPGTIQLCRDVGLGDQLLAASEGSRKNRYVYSDGRLQKLPGSPLGIVTTKLLSPFGKWALLREPFRKRPDQLPADESVAEFATRRLGREATELFIDALVTGIHAGDPAQLSLQAAFPRLGEFEAKYGSVFRGFLQAAKAKKQAALERGEKPQPQRMWSFREGLGKLAETLEAQVQASVVKGVTVRRVEPTPDGWTVHGEGNDCWPADAIVLACPAYRQAELVAELDGPLAEEMAAVSYNKVAVVALGYRQADAPTPDGFGYIAPQRTRRDVLGVQWCSAIFPGRAPDGMVLWRALCGGVNRADVFDLDDDSLTKRCHQEMQAVMGVTGEPVFAKVIRWPRAIPQYVVGHPERLRRIESRVAELPGLFLAGNAYHGIAMNDVTERSFHVAKQVQDYIQVKQAR